MEAIELDITLEKIKCQKIGVIRKNKPLFFDIENLLQITILAFLGPGVMYVNSQNTAISLKPIHFFD